MLVGTTFVRFFIIMTNYFNYLQGCPMTKRYLIVSMLMLATIITYAQRMTFHLILMDYATSVPVANRSNDSSILCTWTEMEQGVSLSIYYVGFALGLRFSCPFKSRWKIALGILLSSVATLLIAAAKSCGKFAVFYLKFKKNIVWH